jgi:hypothetical protein
MAPTRTDSGGIEKTANCCATFLDLLLGREGGLDVRRRDGILLRGLMASRPTPRERIALTR